MLIVVAQTAHADVLVGQGFGKTREASKSEALADLASIIKVRVYSKHEQTTTYNSNNKSTNINRFTRILTDVKLISPQVEITQVADGFTAKAYLGDVALYAKKLQELTDSIDTLADEANKATKASVKYSLLMKAIPIYSEYLSYANTAVVAGYDNFATPKQSLEQVLALVSNMRQSPTSLDMAATALTFGIDKQKVYVDIPHEVMSSEATEFGIFFKALLDTKLDSVTLPQQSNFKFACTYADVADYLQLICLLKSGATNVVRSTVVEIDKSLLANLDYKSKNNDVMAILNDKSVSAESLRVGLRVVTDTGSLVVKGGEKFSVEVKVNEPAFIYLAGYANESSNILELGLDGSFWRYIPASQKGEWVSLGSFTAAEPYGAITLQAFAMESQPTIGVLPKYAWDNFNTMSVRGDKLANDLISLFNKIKTQKAYAHTTVTTIGE